MKDMLTIIYTSKNGICTTTEFMQYLQYVYKGNKAIFCMSIICIFSVIVFFIRHIISALQKVGNMCLVLTKYRTRVVCFLRKLTLFHMKTALINNMSFNYIITVSSNVNVTQVMQFEQLSLCLK